MTRSPEPDVLDSKWVYAAVIGMLVTASACLLSAHHLNSVTGIELGVTFITGFWYAIRFHYTKTIGAPRAGIIGKLFTALIAVVGLGSYFIVGHKFWFLGIVIVLVLGIQKDFEIIITQRRIQQGLSQRERWRSQLIVMHHWYSAIRDLSVSAWWLIYGVQLLVTSHGPTLELLVLFALPYSLLVIFWCVIKEQTHNIEATLWSPLPEE